MHVVASQPIETCPLVEYLTQKMRNYYEFEKHEPRPVAGMLPLPNRPGFGIELDESKIKEIRPISWQQT
jgi:L-alanine-DL-glutamate epimerase-like enolase superfamily enzyme